MRAPKVNGIFCELWMSVHTPTPVHQVEETFRRINQDLMVGPQQKSGDQQRQRGLSSGDHEHQFKIYWQSTDHCSEMSNLDQSGGRPKPEAWLKTNACKEDLFFFFSWSFTSRLSLSMWGGGVVIFLCPVCSWSKVQPLVPRKRGCVSLALASLQRLPVNQSELIFQISLLVFKVLHVDELLPAHISNLLSPYFTLQPSDPSVNFLFQFHTAFPLLLPHL